MGNRINQLLLQFARSFLKDRISAEIFSEAYMELWRIDRDDFPVQEFLSESDKGYFLGECIGSLFIACDRYHLEPNTEFGEFNKDGLKKEIAKLINEYEQKTVKNDYRWKD